MKINITIITSVANVHSQRISEIVALLKDQEVQWWSETAITDHLKVKI